ncbi:MAG: hypothetical protein M1826_004410 [Phylliscum demangeonii]|nr:MAG: hypothetical protein M1826_004410 [Phylliscum demangeonii]
MPKVLVIGATGYLGRSICRALRQDNHRVWGLARTSAQALSLTQDEITAVQGTVQEPSAFLTLIRDQTIDVVIDASGAMDASFQLLSELVRVGAERLQPGPGPTQQRLGFIYTSGMWVHGSSRAPVADLDPVGTASAATPPASIVAWRPQLERDILAARATLDVVVLRPALMYGLSSAIWRISFGPIAAAAAATSGATVTATVPAKRESLVGLAHVEDVAAAYALAAERCHSLAGTGVVPVFDLQTSREQLGVVCEAFARAVGLRGQVEYADPKGNVFAEAMSAESNGDSDRARRLLGWCPTRSLGLAARMEVYAPAFVAAMQDQQGLQKAGAEK